MIKMLFLLFEGIVSILKNEGVFYHPGRDVWFEGSLDEAVELDVKREANV